MDWEAVKAREKEVVALWKPRSEETPTRVNCYDCTSDFLYEYEPGLTVQHIREGRFRWDEPDKTIPLCAMHLSIRQAGEEKYSLARLDRLQVVVGQWGRLTFPDSTPETILDHLAEEVVELLGAERVETALRRAWKGQHLPPTDNPAEESADILLMLLHLAVRREYNLMEATLKKFREVEDAEWVDDGRGYMKRVKPDESKAGP